MVQPMNVYLPIANLAVNVLVIVGLGAITGLLSGMFGVGGGFLTTPLLIFYGVPPTVAAASAASARWRHCPPLRATSRIMARILRAVASTRCG